MNEIAAVISALLIIFFNLYVAFTLSSKYKENQLKGIVVFFCLLNIGILFWQLAIISITYFIDSLLVHQLAFSASLFAVIGGIGVSRSYRSRALPFMEWLGMLLLFAFGILTSVAIFNSRLIISDYDVFSKTVIFGELGGYYLVLLAVLIFFLTISFAVRYYLEIEERYYFKYAFSAFSLYVLLAIVVNFIFPFIGFRNLTLLGTFFVSIPQIVVYYTLFSKRLRKLEGVLAILAAVFSLSVGLFLFFVILDKLFLNLEFRLLLVFLVGYFLTQKIQDIVVFWGKIFNFAFYKRSEVIENFSEQISQSNNYDHILNLSSKLIYDLLSVEEVSYFIFDNFGEVERTSSSNYRVSLLKDVVKNSEKKIYEYKSGKIFFLVIKLVFDKKLIGLFLISRKKNYDPFVKEDIDLLGSLSSIVSSNLSRLSLYEEVKAFSKELEEKVRLATADLKAKNKNLTILRELDTIIVNNFELKQTLSNIVDLLIAEFAFTEIHFALVDENLNKETFSLKYSTSQDLVGTSKKLLGSTLFQDEERKKVFKDVSSPISVDFDEGFESYLCKGVFLKSGELFLVFYKLDKSIKTKSPETLLNSIFAEIGIAINGAILFERLDEINKTLNAANLRLKELDQMKDELVSVASHELRTPMTAIKGYLWMALNKEGENLNEKTTQYLTRSYESTERLIELVNDMLSVSRLEGKRITLELQDIVLQDFVQTILNDLMPRASEKGLVLVSDINSKDLVVSADETRLREVMMNVVGNALKYTDHGSVTIAAKEKVDKDNKHMVEIEVRDTGQGIDQKDMAKLFTKFGKLQQGSFVRSAEEGGTGLGLYIAKGMVELHGGEIWAESRAGKGSSFFFTLAKA